MDELNAVGDPELRSALLYARSTPHAVSADDLAAKQCVHRNVARSRLDRLARAGLLTPSFERRSGRSGPGGGRPARVYSVPPSLTPIEFPERRYELLVGHLLDALPERGKIARLREAGQAFGSDLALQSGLRPAKTLVTGLQRMCAAVGTLGYQASVAEVSAGAAVVVTATCPLRPIVRTRAQAAEIDRGLWTGLTAAALGVSTDVVECRTCDCHADESSCRVLLTVSSHG